MARDWHEMKKIRGVGGETEIVGIRQELKELRVGVREIK